MAIPRKNKKQGSASKKTQQQKQKKNSSGARGASSDKNAANKGPQKFRCANKDCEQILVTPPADEIRGQITQVTCKSCDTANYLQYHCWACNISLDGIDYTAKGVQGQCPDCGVYNPGKKPREKDSCDDASNRCIDRIMFGFTAFIQPYCVYSQLMWIYPFVLQSMNAQGSTLEKVLYGITLFVSAGTLFNYWSGVFTPVKLKKLPKRGEFEIESDPSTKGKLSMRKYHYCVQCKAPRAPRDHHCSICRTCVPIMDHHCPFYGGSCVGRHNHRNFILFLLYMMLTTTWLATSTAAFFNHLPGFPSFIFKREFSKKIMTECRGGSPFCPLSFVWSHEEVSMFGVVVIQFLLTILTLILVSVLFQQQVCVCVCVRARVCVCCVCTWACGSLRNTIA